MFYFQTLLFIGVRVAQSLVLCVVFYRSLFVCLVFCFCLLLLLLLLSFFFWPVSCLSVFDLRIFKLCLAVKHCIGTKYCKMTFFYYKVYSIKPTDDEWRISKREHLLLTINTRHQSYCDARNSRCGMNQMWILKNSKDLIEYIQSMSSSNSIKTFDYSLHNNSSL